MCVAAVVVVSMLFFNIFTFSRLELGSFWLKTQTTWIFFARSILFEFKMVQMKILRVLWARHWPESRCFTGMWSWRECDIILRIFTEIKCGCSGWNIPYHVRRSSSLTLIEATKYYMRIKLRLKNTNLSASSLEHWTVNWNFYVQFTLPIFHILFIYFFSFSFRFLFVW